MPDLTLMPDEQYEPIRGSLLGHLGVLVGTGSITPTDAARYIDILGLAPDAPETTAHRPNMRALPVDWDRRGAVGL